jgi:hypothetical protein
MTNIKQMEVSAIEHAEALRKLTLCVQKQVMARDSGKSLFNIHQEIANDADIGTAIRTRYIDVFLAHGYALLGKVEGGRLAVDDSSVFAVPEVDDSVLEAITADWLALYFLGVPCADLWESVTFFAEGSGFPRGASLCKAVGDVYRRARKTWLRTAPRPESPNTLVYVLDHNPVRMWKKDAPEKMAEPGNVIHYLGAMYEFLQLRLYLKAGGPMRFYVPHASLQRALGATSEALNEQIGFMWFLLTLTFPKQFMDRQLVHIVCDENVSVMSGCVVSPIQGIFRVRENLHGKLQASTPAPERAGNYLASRICEEFRKSMMKVNIDNAPTLQSDEKIFREKCYEIAGPLPT